jgi:predicted transcriptional regulator
MTEMMIMRTVTIKLDDKLKRRMTNIAINWSEYIRREIADRIELEDRKKAAAKLLEGLQRGENRVPRGFVKGVIRETRKAR